MKANGAIFFISMLIFSESLSVQAADSTVCGKLFDQGSEMGGPEQLILSNLQNGSGMAYMLDDSQLSSSEQETFYKLAVAGAEICANFDTSTYRPVVHSFYQTH
jgi:hypothetical protein